MFGTQRGFFADPSCDQVTERKEKIMNQSQVVSQGAFGFRSLQTQAKAIAVQKEERRGISRTDRRSQIVETLAGLHTENSSTASYSQRLLAFTDR